MPKFFRRLLRPGNYLQINGDRAERFINLCAKNNIRLEEIRRTDKYVYAYARGFCESRIKELAAKADTEVTIIEKSGLFYKFIHYRNRIAFFLMPFILLIVLFILSRYIWSVEITGNRFITNDILYSYLELQNWSYGCPISGMIPEDMERQMREDFPVITWVNVVIKGTCLRIDIKENEYAAAGQPADTVHSPGRYRNIVSGEQGIVSSIITRSGIPLCREGDTVSQGQILVSGEIPIYNNTGDTIISHRYVDADADIMLQYCISYLDFEPHEISVKEYTGMEKESFYIMTHTGGLDLKNSDNPFETYDIYSTEYQLRCMDNFYLPCYYGKIEYRETVFHNVYRDDYQVTEILEQNYSRYLKDLSSMGIEVLEDEIQYIPGVEGIYLSVRLTVCAPCGVSTYADLPTVPSQEELTTE